MMEKSSSLTCILCKKLIPAKEHVHNCGDENYVKIQEYSMPSGFQNIFSIVGHIPMKVVCKFCNKNETSIIKVVTKNGDYTPESICQECAEERTELAAKIARKNERERLAYEIAYDKAMEETINLIESDGDKENSRQILECEYCGASFELGPDDFMIHQEFCKNN